MKRLPADAARIWICASRHDFRIAYWETYAPTKLYYNGGFNVIDATLLPARGRYYLIVKDET
jgi:hypothetical protein